jgi:arylsulfatase A-like enzyme
VNLPQTPLSSAFQPQHHESVAENGLEYPAVPPLLATIWLHLSTLTIVTLVFHEALYLAGGSIQSWSNYLRAPEVAFELLVQLALMAVVGLLAGTLATIVIAPVLWFYKTRRQWIADVVTKLAIVASVFVILRSSLASMVGWAHGFKSLPSSTLKVLLVAFYLAFAASLFIRKSRRHILTSLDGFLTEKMTRRTAMVTVAGTAGLAVAEYVLSKRLPIVKAALPAQRPKNNILLISFDALAAEDMSLYGGSRPTTPFIDDFAARSTVFTRFYSGSTFTTPSVATMLTGLYPSESKVYQLQGRLSAENAKNSLPYLLRSGGYATGGFVSNPYAYFLATDLRGGFNILPEPQFRPGSFQWAWNATRPLHQYSGVGSRTVEYFNLDDRWHLPGQVITDPSVRMRPDLTFAQAKQVLSQLPDGFFLWVHLITPHDPYIPDVADLGRFLPASESTSFIEESVEQWWPHYSPQVQKQIDRRRLAYDEFLLAADRAFGAFIGDVDTSGRLQNTTVILTADHGESFEGGVYQHRSPYLTRPVIHIPLIVRSPGQKDGRKVDVTADQTALAPTVLDLAGVSKPTSMRGRSLRPWLEGNGKETQEDLAFCQYFERNSVYKPVREGSVGVIEGDYQYVYLIDMQKSGLRPIQEAQIWDLDRSAEHPEIAEALQRKVRDRFPGMIS